MTAVNLKDKTTNLDFKISALALSTMYGATSTDIIPFIEKHMLTYNINSKQRMSGFLSACLLLSSGFRRRAENYSYTAIRLFKECDKVDSFQLATRLVRNGEREIANYLFSFENGNGGIDSDDGWQFRARTPLQFRGRTLYELVNSVTGIDCVNNPDLLDDVENSIIAAMVFWETEGFNEIMDLIKFDGTHLMKVRAGIPGRARDYHSNRSALKLKLKLNNSTTGLTDFCNCIELGMLHL